MVSRETGTKKYFLPSLFVALFLFSCGPTPANLDSIPIDTASDPIQESITYTEPLRFARGGYQWLVTPLAKYTLRGIVLHRKKYYFGWQAVISCCDFAVAWGMLLKNNLYKQVSWSQNGRWYNWSYASGFPEGNPFIIRYSSNTHIIPANENLEKAVKFLRAGDPVQLSGFLVRIDVQKENQTFWWTSSLSRTDEGDGSCELLYLNHLKVDGKVYR